MSEKMNLNKEDGIKIAKGAAIAVGGALIVYVAEIIPNVNFGEWTPIVVGVASIILNAARKWLENKK